MLSISCDNETIATLHVNRIGQPRSSQVIREDECLSVGSDPSADICLTDDDIASTHCMLIARSGIVTVRDCFSESGTFVDRVRVREIQLQTDAELRVGRTTISVKLSRSSPQPASARNDSTPSPETKPETSVIAAAKVTQAITPESTKNRKFF